MTGTYQVILTASNVSGNTDSSTAIITAIDSTMGLDDLSSQNINLYPVPVPATHTLYINVLKLLKKIYNRNYSGIDVTSFPKAQCIWRLKRLLACMERLS